MGRFALAAGGALVAALVVALLIKTRAGGDEPVAAGRPVEKPSDEVGDEAVERADGPASGSAPAPAPALPAAQPEDDAEDDTSPLPTPAEEAEARKRVAAERERPSHLSPDLVMDHKLKARPMRDARKAYQRGEYEVALARAQDALAVEPESNSARVLATLAACAMGKSAVANAHANKLDDMRRARVVSRCQGFGVELDLSPTGGD